MTQTYPDVASSGPASDASGFDVVEVRKAKTSTGDKVIANIRMWADGHRPPDQVLEGWV